MIKLISFIVLSHLFQFNELKILRQPGDLLFYVKPTIFFYSDETYGFIWIWYSALCPSSSKQERIKSYIFDL